MVFFCVMHDGLSKRGTTRSVYHFGSLTNMLLSFHLSSLSVSKNVTVDNSPYKMTAEEATGIINHVSYFSFSFIFSLTI